VTSRSPLPTPVSVIGLRLPHTLGNPFLGYGYLREGCDSYWSRFHAKEGELEASVKSQDAVWDDSDMGGFVEGWGFGYNYLASTASVVTEVSFEKRLVQVCTSA
jgi:hypothetical protein